MQHDAIIESGNFEIISCLGDLPGPQITATSSLADKSQAGPEHFNLALPGPSRDDMFLPLVSLSLTQPSLPRFMSTMCPTPTTNDIGWHRAEGFSLEAVQPTTTTLSALAAFS
jgi:hypothetical protein